MIELGTGGPWDLFNNWMAEAAASEPNDPNAMTLATVGADGRPSARIVLLKGVDPEGATPRGLVFYTNLGSRKGVELAARPDVALLFHWKTRRRQVRVEGPAGAVDAAEADAYFRTRPRVSRLGAWASDQSRPLADRAALENRLAALEAQYPDDDVPRPPHWSGFRVVPQQWEFWQDGAFRLHDRLVVRCRNGKWDSGRLYP